MAATPCSRARQPKDCSTWALSWFVGSQRTGAPPASAARHQQIPLRLAGGSTDLSTARGHFRLPSALASVINQLNPMGCSACRPPCPPPTCSAAGMSSVNSPTSGTSPRWGWAAKGSGRYSGSGHPSTRSGSSSCRGSAPGRLIKLASRTTSCTAAPARASTPPAEPSWAVGTHPEPVKHSRGQAAFWSEHNHRKPSSGCFAVCMYARWRGNLPKLHAYCLFDVLLMAC
jgi:hypothetical protein